MAKWMHSGPVNGAQPIQPDGSFKAKATRAKKTTTTKKAA